MTAALVAHQGGWDEILMVAGPLAAIALALVVAKRRADRLPPAPSTDDESLNRPAPPTPRAR